MAACVLTEARGAVLLITLDRPEARNAVNAALARELAAALQRLDSEPQWRAGVLTGAGAGFCAGMDLKAYLAGESPDVAGRGFAGIAQRPPAKPLIAAVEGFAVAGGLEIALACDLIVAARDAKLALPEVRRGLVAAAGGLLRLSRRVPHQLAMELALTGAAIDGERAERAGLVAHCTEPGQALERALALAGAIVANAPLAVRATKRILDEQWGWTPAQAWIEQAAIAAPVSASADAREGALAFAEKRSPVWRGE